MKFELGLDSYDSQNTKFVYTCNVINYINFYPIF